MGRGSGREGGGGGGREGERGSGRGRGEEVYACGSGRRGGRGLVVGWRGRCGEGDGILIVGSMG